ncbi:ABC transporter ATP-binding protein [candidate division WOR-3 bacterium]|nr:ABC transporter ATP-binding protein [candidate division WOR-3 bacterium]
MMHGGGQRSFVSDEVKSKKPKLWIIKRLAGYFKPYIWIVLAATLMLMIVSALQIVPPYLTKVAIDKYIATKNFTGIYKIAGIYLLVLILQLVIQYAEIMLTEYVGQRVMIDIRMKVFEHLENLSMTFFDKNPIGRLVTRVTNDVEALHELFTGGVVAIIGDFFTIIAIVIVMLKMSISLTVASFVLLPAFAIAAYIFSIKSHAAYLDVRKYVAESNANLQENLSGVKVVQAFAREDRNYKGYERINKNYVKASFRAITINTVFFPVVEALSSISIGLIIWYGGGKSIQGAVSAGTLVAFISYVKRFFDPIRDLGEKYNIVQNASASSFRIFKLLDTKMLIKDAPDKKQITPKIGQIEFKNVVFSYNKGETILKNISFKIERGEKVAFVGATGAGKTSIISIIPRLYDIDSGEILIDDIDIRKYDKKCLRAGIGMVLQEPFIFAGTVFDNIALWDKSITLDEVKRAAEIVNLAPFVERRRKGYYEEVGERGSNFSQGERQMIAFARVFIKNPPILIMDEATSSIDTQTEALIQDALLKIMEGRTSIIVAHRLSTIKNVNRIFVVHKGKIVEEGDHQSLLAKKGVYYKLYKLQYAD